MAAFEPFVGQTFAGNDYISVDSAALNFCEHKCSGIGSLFCHAGLNRFRQIKMVTINPKPTVRDWWYSYPNDWFYSSSR